MKLLHDCHMWDSLSLLFDNVVSPALFLDIALRKIWQYSSGHWQFCELISLVLGHNARPQRPVDANQLENWESLQFRSSKVWWRNKKITWKLHEKPHCVNIFQASPKLLPQAYASSSILQCFHWKKRVTRKYGRILCSCSISQPVGACR